MPFPRVAPGTLGTYLYHIVRGSPHAHAETMVFLNHKSMKCPSQVVFHVKLKWVNSL